MRRPSPGRAASSFSYSLLTIIVFSFSVHVTERLHEPPAETTRPRSTVGCRGHVPLYKTRASAVSSDYYARGSTRMPHRRRMSSLPAAAASHDTNNPPPRAQSRNREQLYLDRRDFSAAATPPA